MSQSESLPTAVNLRSTQWRRTLNNWPLVSCLTPTYARPELLREAIWCFLQQDYPNKELIVLNDHPNQLSLEKPYPGVRLYNTFERFSSLGAKRNHCAQLARGDFLFPWDDDDLSLPWRITQTMQHLLAAPEKWAFKPTAAWMSTSNMDYVIVHNVLHAQLGMRRSAFQELAGYAEMNSGEDLEFESRIPQERWLHYPARVSEMHYVYRWGNSVTHISGLGEDVPGKPTSWEIIEQLHARKPGGAVTPGFDQDYWQDLLNAASESLKAAATEVQLLGARLTPYLGKCGYKAPCREAGKP